MFEFYYKHNTKQTTSNGNAREERMNVSAMRADK